MKTMFKFVEDIYSFGERQGGNLKLAIDFIKNMLNEQKIDFSILTFSAKIPLFENYWLKVDNKLLDCLPSGLISGTISGLNLVENTSEEDNIFSENINFNPFCNEISRMDFYDCPALTIKKSDVSIVKKSKKVEGLLDVKIVDEFREQILVGNLSNPKNIVFTHVDSFGSGGAIDNAVSNGLLLEVIIENKGLLVSNLFVFDSCEELSLNDSKYWCFGYREFEKKHLDLLKNCDQIFVLDGIGIKTHISQQKKDIEIAFALKNDFSSKTTMFIEDTKYYLKYCHSKLDSLHIINKNDVIKMKQEFLKLIKKASVSSS